MTLNKIIINILLLSFLSGCSSYSRITNVELKEEDENHFYFQRQHIKNNSDLKIFMSFSGGGTRAAAFSYGVLEALRETKISKNNETISLLSEVDMISSVSGGSFTAAYYGLYGDEIFENYERVFLKENIQKSLVSGILNPVNWFRFIGSSFDRTELAVDHYDKSVFEGATFADFRLDMPFIKIMPTDLAVVPPLFLNRNTLIYCVLIYHNLKSPEQWLLHLQYL